MSELGISPIRKEGFALAPSLEGTTLTVTFTGNGDMSATATLAGYLKVVHGEAIRQKVREVAFDLRELYFMNSSCLKSFVSWIDTVSGMADKGRYRIRFISNPALAWQRRSLEALRCLADELVSVEA